MNIREAVSRYLFGRSEVRALRALAESIRYSRPALEAGQMSVVVDGFLPIKWLAFYYALLLLVVERLSGKRVKVILLSPSHRAQYWAAARLYTHFFPMVRVVVNGPGSQRHYGRVSVAPDCSDIKCGDELFSFCYNSVNIGEDAYYGCLREKRVGTVRILDARDLKIVGAAVENAKYAEMVIDSFRPELMLISHSSYETFGPIFKTFLKSGVRVALTCPYGKFPRRLFGRLYTTLSDFIGVKRRHAISFDDNTWDIVKKEYGEIHDAEVADYLAHRFAGDDAMFDGRFHKNTLRADGDELRRQLELLPEDHRKIVLVAAHLLWDDPGYAGLYRDYEIWLRETLKIIARNREVLWLVKAHPSEVHYGTNRYVKEIFSEVFPGRCPDHIRFIEPDTNLNTYSLIDFANAILTVRGTIGFEAACRGRAVISAGDSPFTDLGFAVEFDDIPAYEAYLLGIQHENTELDPARVRLARMGLYGYLLRKAPISEIFSRGVDLGKYANGKPDELLQDGTLTRFAETLLAKKAGDLL